MRRLYWRVYLHFLGVLLVVGLATSVVFAVGSRGAFVRDLAERITRHAASLVAERFGDPAQLARRVQRLHEDFDLNVTVRDPGGRVLASAGDELPDLGPAEAGAVRAGSVVVYGRPRWLAVAPILNPDSGAVVGTLHVSGRRRFGTSSLLHPVLVTALVLLIVAVATAPLARRITRPVERLTEATRRIGGGDLSYRVRADAPRRRRRSWKRRRRVDELAELTRAFNEMAERVERLVRGQRELLANVSHELRSPLARIRIALELLPRDGDAEARLVEVARDLDELERLVDDVLTTARLEATRLPTHLGRVDVSELLTQVAERARHDPLVADGTVQVATEAPIVLVADGALLKRALSNLVENAAKYGAPPITLAARAEGDHALLSVTDEGPGIPANERERVFTPFARLDRARTPGGAGEPPRGFGLGLTLARRVAEVHGGTITIEPARTVDGQERGCRVILRIPGARGR
jgi:signal transduction histidine kinase